MSLAFQSFGNGPALVLLHGLFGSGDNLRILARGLEHRCRVILPDLPNHGSSPHIPASTHQAMADAVSAFLETEGIERPVIGGHSIGGKLAMLLALREPDRFPGLVSIDMAPREYEPSHREILAGMIGMDLELVRSRRDADQALVPYVPHKGVRSFLLKNLVRDGEGYRWRLNLQALEDDYDQMLTWAPPEAEFKGPATFIGGERSSYLQVDRDRQLIHEQFPNAEVLIIPDAGHWLHADKPEALLELINAFFDRTGLA